MIFRFPLLLLGAVLLVENFNAAPVPKDSSSSEEIGGIFFIGVIKRFKLISLTLDELIEIHKLIIQNGVKVFKKVLEDPKVLEVKDEIMEEYKIKLQKIVDQLKKSPDETESKTFELLGEFSGIVDQFTENENLSEEAKIIKKSLKENGLDDFQTLVKNHFTNFITKFTKELDDYIKDLDENEKKKEEALITWFEKLKAETDVEKQFDMFDSFFSIANNSSSESSE